MWTHYKPSLSSVIPSKTGEGLLTGPWWNSSVCTLLTRPSASVLKVEDWLPVLLSSIYGYSDN